MEQPVQGVKDVSVGTRSADTNDEFNTMWRQRRRNGIAVCYIMSRSAEKYLGKVKNYVKDKIGSEFLEYT